MYPQSASPEISNNVGAQKMGVPGGKAELSGEVSGSEKGVGSPSEHLSTCRALCPPSLPSGLAQVVPGAGGLREQARTEAGGRTARDPSAEGLRSQVQGGGYVSPGVQKGMCASPPAPAPSPLPQGNLETQSWRGGGTTSGLGGAPRIPTNRPGPSSPSRQPRRPCFRVCHFCLAEPQKSVEDTHTDRTVKPMQLC